MPNEAGIADHNGENAETLAQGYKQVIRREAYPKLYAFADGAARDGKALDILDIGSGSGVDAIEMAKLGHHVVGIEPSDLRSIAMRDNGHPNIDYRNDTLPALHSLSTDEKFDLVMLSTVWHYIDPAERVPSLLKIATALKPGGKLVLSYPSPPSRVHQYEISPAMVAAEIAEANAQLPPSKQLAMQGAPEIIADTRGRKGLNGQDLNFYTFTIASGHAQAIGPRTGWAKYL